MIGFKKSAPILHSIRSKTETRTLWLVLTHFNINCTCIYFKFWLVHWIVCALRDCFVIIFVLVFWDSIENQSIVMCLSEQWYFLNHSGFAVSTNKHSQFMACSNCYAVIQFHLKANTDSTYLKCIPYITTTKFVSTSKMPSQLIMYKNFSWYYNKKQQKYNKVHILHIDPLQNCMTESFLKKKQWYGRKLC